uniref:Wsv432-like protein n=1 Tax=Penaeus monodon majanivirus B TaxID=2984272 RepID=A0A9C7CCN7_9VIRU|nr:MAG: wsv432-like protein [Penaeus monodon majanivirus B]
MGTATTTNGIDDDYKKYTNIYFDNTNKFVQISDELKNPPKVISDIQAARHSKYAISIQSVASVPTLPKYIAKILLPRALDSLEKSRGAVVFEPLSGIYEPNLYNLVHRRCLEKRPLTTIKTLRKLLND